MHKHCNNLTCVDFFLQVSFLSEISITEVTMLDESIINNTTKNRSKSNLLWLHQSQPTQEYWQRWIREIKNRYFIPGTWELKRQFVLGKWIQPHHNLTHKYECLFPHVYSNYPRTSSYMLVDKYLFQHSP